jgi:hypothetical protein
MVAIRGPPILRTRFAGSHLDEKYGRRMWAGSTGASTE